MMKKKNLFCFIDTIESWNYLKKEYKNLNKIICTASPELLLDKSIKEKKITLDEKNISIIKPLSSDLGDLSEKVVKKIKSKGLSHNFAVQYASFILGFSNILRFSTVIDDSYLTKKVIVIKNELKNSIIKRTLDLPIEKILKENKNLEVKKVKISEKKFQSNLKSPNLILRLIFNGLKNFEFLIWREIWKICPLNLTKGLIILGLDGPFLRETAVYLSRQGYKFKVLPKRNIVKFAELDHNLLKKINVVEKDVKKIFKKYLTKKIEKIVFKVFKSELKLFIQMYNYNYSFWDNYFLENFNYSKIKCFLSTHLIDNAFVALSEILIKKKIPIFNFQHGHAREVRKQPEFDKWQTCYEPIADQTFVYNKNSEIRTTLINKVSRGNHTSVGVPSVYKKNKILFKNPKYKIIFFSNSNYTGLRRSQIPFNLWSDTKRINLEINIIDKVLKNLPHNILFKLYPTPANLSENLIKKKISNFKNISIVKKNIDASYFYYSKRVVFTYSANSTLGWALLSKLPLVYINVDFMPLRSDIEKKMINSVFYFNYNDKKVFENLTKFLSQPIDKIFQLWDEKRNYRDELIKEFSDNELESAGKLASEHILNKFN